MPQAGLFGLSEHLKRLSAHGDPLEVLARVVDFEAFRPVLDVSLAYSDGAKGGWPPYDPVTMLKVLVLAAQNNLADGRMEYLIRDRLSWLRFLGFDLGAPTPDANTMRLFRERLTQAGALDMLFADFDPWIALGLRELGVAIACIDARQAHQSLKAMKANKTDLHDAAALAQLARTGFYKDMHVKSPAAHGVRSVIAARGHLVVDAGCILPKSAERKFPSLR